MYGKGILKGLSVTWKRFWNTYIDDIAWLLRGKKRYYSEEGIKHRSSKNTRGIFTIQYPEERLIAPEEMRFVPFLVYDEKPEGKRELRPGLVNLIAANSHPRRRSIMGGGGGGGLKG